MANRGSLAGKASQWMYFETGQGSEVSYGSHDGIDMATCEALSYGLARRYETLVDPRLNHQQSLEMAFQVVQLMRGH